MTEAVAGIMHLLGQYLLNGVAAGSLYALVALGIVTLYRTSRVLNFAHGDLATLGVFVAYAAITRLRVPYGVGALSGLLAAGLAGALFYWGVLRPARDATPLGRSIMSLGLALLLGGVTTVVWGSDIKRMPFPLSESRLVVVGPAIVISELHLGGTAAALLLMGALHGIVEHTPFGLAMRAVSQDVTAARLLGISAHRVLAGAWAVSAGLGAAAGLLLAPVTLLDPFFMLNPFLKGFAAAVMGGLDSAPGAVAGGVGLGVLESLLSGYVSVAFKSTLAFLLIVAVLLVRPEGLMGREFQRRV